ncbi:MAG: glycosyltransferase family 2 protein [Pseudomonadota bacterium]
MTEPARIDVPTADGASGDAATAPLRVDVAITMINFRTAEMTIECAKSVLEHAGEVSFRLMLVDNNSADGSADRIADWIADLPEGSPVELVRSDVNTGFAGGHNLGITACPGTPFVLLLNSDAVIRPGALTAMLAAMQADPKIGIIGPALLNRDEAVEISAFRFHSPWSELNRAANSGPISRLLRRRVVAIPTPPNPAEIEWISFACALIRREIVEAHGGLDEGYFMYFEDADLCAKAKADGWRIAYLPEAEIVHFRGGSAPVKSLAKARKRLPRYYYASRARLLYRLGGHAGLIGANLLWHIGRAICWTRALTGRPVHRAVRAEWRDIWTNALHPLGPRHGPDD